MQLKDGQSMKIDIDGSGKKSVKFQIDNQEFEIDLKRDKLDETESNIDDEILENQQEEFKLNNLLNQNLQDEIKKEHLELDGLTEEEKQEQINNIKVKTLKDQGIPLTEAADFVKTHEGVAKFDYEQFKLSVEEQIEILKEEFDKVQNAKKGRKIKLDVKRLLLQEDEIQSYLIDQKIKVVNDLQDEQKSLHITIINNVFNIIDDLFKNIKTDVDRNRNNFDNYNQIIKKLEEKLNKIN